MLTPLFDRLENWHSAKFERPWLGPLPMTRALILAALVMALIAFFANVKVRYDQGQIWKAHPEVTEIAGAMSFSTADAPNFLGRAAVAKNGLSPDEFDRRRVFPTKERAYQQRENKTSTRKHPLLSTLISFLSPSASPGDLLNAGHLILLINAGLTACMIILAFGATGYWLEGSVAAIGGGLSLAYLVRSSFGRIDTDQLNLGLMYLMFGLLMMSARSKTYVAAIIGSIAAGATASIFMAWYNKPELIWMAVASFAWLLIAIKKDLKITGLCLFVFYTIAPIRFPNPFESNYVQDYFALGNFSFPNTLETITEVAGVSFPKILSMATGSMEMGLVCLIGLAVWAIRHPVMAVAYGPLTAFALLNFVIGNRAVFYSAPMMWFGAAFLLTTTCRFLVLAAKPNSEEINSPYCFKRWAGLKGALLALIVAWVNSPTDYLPRPSFPKPVLEGMLELETIATPRQSVVASWWDYGYASLFLNNLPVLHDGASQLGPTTHLFAYALLRPDQAETKGILQFLASQTTEDVERHASKAELFAEFDGATESLVADVYLVLTKQMAGWMGSISKLANWDIETGKPVLLQNNKGKAYVEYIGLGCNYRSFPARVACGNVSFDFDQGLMNDAPAIVGWAHAHDGFVKDVRRYREDATFGVQTLQTNNRLSSQLMHRQLYDSSFNKLYHLGLVEVPGITLVYDNYPHIRIYRIAGKD